MIKVSRKHEDEDEDVEEDVDDNDNYKQDDIMGKRMTGR